MTFPSISWNPELWRARALRYTLIYLLLACVLVALRYQTREVYPDLRALRAERAQLAEQKQALELDVQARTSSAVVREWALANDMTPFSRAHKDTAAFDPLPAPVPVAPARPLEVHTRWK